MAVDDTIAAEAIPTSTPTSGTCPACDAGRVNGQGLYTCSECGWTETG